MIIPLTQPDTRCSKSRVIPCRYSNIRGDLHEKRRLQIYSGFIQFTDRFSSEDACRRFLFATRWPNGYACPRCGSVRYAYIETRDLYQCRDCRYQVSVTAGTIMEKTRSPLRAWFWMMFLMANQKTGISILGASRMIGISYKRASLMAQKIRQAMASRDT